MKFNRFLMISALALFVAGCGASKDAQKTGTENVKVTNTDLKGSVSSTGKCQTFKNDKERKDLEVKYSLYREPFKAKNYSEGLQNWQYVIAKFPGFRKTPFYDGIEMYKSQMEAADGATKEDLQRKVMSLYDNLSKCHGDEGRIARLKANEYLKWDKAFGTDNSSTVTKLYEESMNIMGNDVESSVLKYLWAQYRNDFKSKVRTESEVLAFGEKIKQIAQANIAANKSPTAFEDIVSSVNKGVVQKVSTGGVKPDMTTCEGIEAYFQKFVDAQDKKQCTQARLRMDKIGCKSPFYNAVLAIAPPATKKTKPEVALFREGIDLYKSKNFGAAEAKLKEALNANSSPAFEEQINFYIGNTIYAQKNYQGAAPFYEQIVATGSKYKGKSYIALGNCYLGAYGKCGTSPKEKAAVAWVAADMFQSAMSDPESSAKASEKLSKTREYFLEKGELFMAGIQEGSTINVGCWINKSTTVRGK